MSSRKFVSLLARGDARLIRQQGTSHAIFERIKDGKTWHAPVVMAKPELSPHYMYIVLRQLGFTDDEINELYG
jgi:hypothetical protein